MEDSRVWAFEESLWTADPAHYQESIDESYLAVIPKPPHVLQGQDAIDALSSTPKWDEVAFSEQRIVRPQEGLIVVAYKVEASREGADTYVAYCSSTYRRLGHDDWRVVQHQQTPPLVSGGE